MKRIFPAAALTLALALTAVLSGCGLFSAPKADANFPSDVAASRGEESETEWLASLSEPTTELRRAYEEAKTDGYTGSYLEFLSALSLPSDDSLGVQTALRSTVSVNAGFTKREGVRNVSYRNLGSGVFLDVDTAEGDALVLTNYHVVYSAGSLGSEKIAHISDEIVLYTFGAEVSARAIEATFLGGAMEYDIAVLRVEDSEALRGSAARAVVAADSDSLVVGQTAYAVGNADGQGISVTQGGVSVTAEYVPLLASDDVTSINLLEIRTDAPINHGNSGGGLFNAEGRLIGIVNARLETEGKLGFGYAIPANRALAIAHNILDACAASSSVRGARVATLGVTIETEDSAGRYDEETGRYYIEQKSVIRSITRGSLAERMGLEIADTFVTVTLRSSGGAVRTAEITRGYMVADLLFEARVGDTLEVSVSRGGELIVKTAELASRDFQACD